MVIFDEVRILVVGENQDPLAHPPPRFGETTDRVWITSENLPQTLSSTPLNSEIAFEDAFRSATENLILKEHAVRP